jgi:glycosidase
MAWWDSGVIYQIYPRGWQDSTGDGVGDLSGIRQRLDHLEWLGVDAIWLNPDDAVSQRGLGL